MQFFKFAINHPEMPRFSLLLLAALALVACAPAFPIGVPPAPGRGAALAAQAGASAFFARAGCYQPCFPGQVECGGSCPSCVARGYMFFCM